MFIFSEVLYYPTSMEEQSYIGDQRYNAYPAAGRLQSSVG
jgi:hypothetical protein